MEETYEARAAARMSEFEARVERMKALAPSRPEDPIQLPFWPEPQRATANAMLRSALFSCARRRAFVRGQTIASWADTSIRFSGDILNQFDETVWMELVHRFRQQGEPCDFKVRFHAKPFMRALGKRRQGGANVGVLRASLVRLRGGTIEIEHKGMVYGGGLLNDFTLDEDRGEFVAVLNPKYLRLLSVGHTQVEWKTRLQLPTGITTWMHRYILSHQATKQSPHRVGLEQLRELCGMVSAPKEFKRVLNQALKKLEQHGVISQWRITPQESLEFSRPSKRRRKP